MQGTNCRVYPQRCFMLASIKWGEENHHHLSFEGWLLPSQRTHSHGRYLSPRVGFHLNTHFDMDTQPRLQMKNPSFSSARETAAGWCCLPRAAVFSPIAWLRKKTEISALHTNSNSSPCAKLNTYLCLNTYYSSNSFVRLENVCSNSPNTTTNKFDTDLNTTPTEGDASEAS